MQIFQHKRQNKNLLGYTVRKRDTSRSQKTQGIQINHEEQQKLICSTIHNMKQEYVILNNYI